VHVQIASDHSLAEPAPVQDDDGQPGDETYLAHSDGSFMFADGAMASSTPLPGRQAHLNSYDSSFSDSMASPFDTIERRLRNDLQLDDSDMPTPSLPSGYDLPPVQLDQSSVMHPSPSPIRQSTSSSSASVAATPKARRPPPATSHTNGMHNGLVDIRTTPLTAKFRPKLSLADLDADDDDYQLNMSPPVTMNFQLPPKATAIISTGRTPRPAESHNHAQRIVDDLMDEMSAEYVPSPRIPTPEGLRRYSVMPPPQAHINTSRNIFADQLATSAAGPSRRTRRSMANTSYGSDMEDMPEEHIYSNEDTMDDSFDSPDPTQYAYNVSTSSAGSDRSDGGTVFGGPRVQQARSAFNLMKPDELVTFHGGRLEDAAGREVADTPTNIKQRER
jgi:DASH complex subunit ASK1